MKKLAILIIGLLLFAVVFTGCGKADASAADKTNGNGISIVCTIFPMYDWTRQIIGDKADNIELTLLQDGSVDLHSYQPTVDDIIKISNCDLFIYVGGESDKWAEDALAQATNPDMTVINLLQVLGDSAKTEASDYVIEEEHDHDSQDDYDGDDEHEYGDNHDEHDSHEGALDEHVWLSIKNSQIFCGRIADALSSLEPEGAENFNNNFDEYTTKLSELDDEYQVAVGESSVKTLLFGDRFPFRYMVDDYGLQYHAAFAGCSAETEASFETIAMLAEKVDALGLKVVMVTESSDQAIAKTIIENTVDKNQKILIMDSLQSVNPTDAEGGATYVSIMESNLTTLKEALG